jgi:hypothetical protein
MSIELNEAINGARKKKRVDCVRDNCWAPLARSSISLALRECACEPTVVRTLGPLCTRSGTTGDLCAELHACLVTRCIGQLGRVDHSRTVEKAGRPVRLATSARSGTALVVGRSVGWCLRGSRADTHAHVR